MDSDECAWGSNTIVSAAFSPDGTRVLTASRDGLAKIWLADSGQHIKTLHAHQGVRGLSFAEFESSFKHILTAGGERAWTPPDPDADAHTDADALEVGDSSWTVLLWDTEVEGIMHCLSGRSRLKKAWFLSSKSPQV